MYIRKSTKGIKRGPYNKQPTRFDKHVAEIFSDRINALGITQAKLLEDNKGKVSTPTLSRILNGNGGSNINTIAAVAEMLGMEIVIRPIQNDTEYENKD